jgi:hypothetical protein
LGLFNAFGCGLPKYDFESQPPIPKEARSPILDERLSFHPYPGTIDDLQRAAIFRKIIR